MPNTVEFALKILVLPFFLHYTSQKIKTIHIRCSNMPRSTPIVWVHIFTFFTFSQSWHFPEISQCKSVSTVRNSCWAPSLFCSGATKHKEGGGASDLIVQSTGCFVCNENRINQQKHRSEQPLVSAGALLKLLSPKFALIGDLPATLV